MGAPANFVWLPLLIMAMAMATLAIAQSNDTSTASTSNDVKKSPSSSTSSQLPTTSSAPDVVVAGDLTKAARVERMSSDMDHKYDSERDSTNENSADNDVDSDAVTTPKAAGNGHYDVIDVMAATSAGVGKPKSGQTTRIYTTGEVNDDFWLKHLGDDFKHAIHLQVGGTNEDYNRIINQTNDGVHEEVHHEYLPGAERPPEAQHQRHSSPHPPPSPNRSYGYGQLNMVSQLSLDAEAMALKQNYLRQQAEHQRISQAGYARSSNTHFSGGHRHVYPTHMQPQHEHTHNQHVHPHSHPHTHPHAHPHTQTRNHKNNMKQRLGLGNRYKHLQSNSDAAAGSGLDGGRSSIINSSEDTLHAAQSQTAPTSATSPSSSSLSRRNDDADNPLPFKSPFNDYGSRPTRDLTYLLYKRGL